MYLFGDHSAFILWSAGTTLTWNFLIKNLVSVHSFPVSHLAQLLGLLRAHLIWHLVALLFAGYRTVL